MIRKSALALTFATMWVFVLSFQTESAKAELPGIGEWTSDGRVEICVHSFHSAPTISYYPYEPERAGYIFAWVDFSLKNVGAEDVSTNRLYAHLKDTDNYLYERTLVDSPKEWQTIDLPPGETLRGEIYFEVPAEAMISKFLWIDYHSYISVVIPEFPSFLILPLFTVVTLLIVTVYKRKTALASTRVQTQNDPEEKCRTIS